jgi:tetratricopeptide (TPR) repeat protein
MGRLEEADLTYEEARVRVLTREARAGESWQPAEIGLWQARIDFRLALGRKVRGEIDAARTLAERAIAAAAESGHTAETPAMWALLAGIHRRAGDLPGAYAASLRGLRVCRGVLARDDRLGEAICSLLITLGGVFYSRRQLVRAERTYRQAARFVDERVHPQAASYALGDAGAVRFARGDMAGARELFARAMRLQERQGDLHAAAVARSNLAEVELARGEVATALAHALGAVKVARRLDARADLPDMLRNLARASLQSGDPTAALDAGVEALQLARLGGGRVYLAEVTRTLREVCAGAATALPERAAAVLAELDAAAEGRPA